MFDGTLARATGQVSRSARSWTRVFDRCGEVIVYLGIVVGAAVDGHRGVPILAAARDGRGVMVSYIRAKSEGLGFSPGKGMAASASCPARSGS